MKRTKKRGRKPQKPNKEFFETMYYNDSIPASQIAEFYGVNTQTIYNWAHSFRKMSEEQGNNTEVSEKQIFHCPTINIIKERSKKTI